MSKLRISHAQGQKRWWESKRRIKKRQVLFDVLREWRISKPSRSRYRRENAKVLHSGNEKEWHEWDTRLGTHPWHSRVGKVEEKLDYSMD